MKAWTDYTRAEQRRLPHATQVRLLRHHLRGWIAYWCRAQKVSATGFHRQLDAMIKNIRDAEAIYWKGK